MRPELPLLRVLLRQQNTNIRYRESAVRVKSKWSNKGRERTLDEVGGAAAFILWRIAQQGLLNLENEGFQTETRSQRMDIIAEFLAFLVHLADRNKAEALDAQERQMFITSLAVHLADTCRKTAPMQRARVTTGDH